MGNRLRVSILSIAFAILLIPPCFAAGFQTVEPAQVRGVSRSGFRSQPLFTVGDEIEGFRPVGALDGTGAMNWTDRLVRVFVNHELEKSQGYKYSLQDGPSIHGARVTYFDIDRFDRTIHAAGLAYDRVVDEAGAIVVSAQQINEGSSSSQGFNRFCSGVMVPKGPSGFVDDIYFCGEETPNGRECALDVRSAALYIVPQLGRHSWENVAVLRDPDPNRVAILSSDDRGGAPLWLYIGTKNAIGDGSFLDRNGLASGTLSVWKTDSGDRTPQDFHGTGSERDGIFVELNHYDPSSAGSPGWDSLGFASRENLDAQAAAEHAFQFSRQEDLSANPQGTNEVLLAATGHGSEFPADNWGDTNLITIDFSEEGPTGKVRIVYDGDDAGGGQFANPDFGLRSPDNIDWAGDGFGYVQEDRATAPASLFGEESGNEASVWKLDPRSGILTRIAEVDRSAIPSGQRDADASELGAWESSGILDVTALFPHRIDEKLFLLDVQAKTLRGQPLGGDHQSEDLVRGGQLLFLASSPRSFEDPQEQDLAAAAGVRVLRHALGGRPAFLELSLISPATVVGRIYDVGGRTVRTILDGPLSSGRSIIEWNGANTDGGAVPPGIYFARFEMIDHCEDARILVIH